MSRDRGQAKLWAVIAYMLLVVGLIFGALVAFEMMGVAEPGLILPP